MSFGSWAAASWCAWKMIVLKEYMIHWRSVLLSVNQQEESVYLPTTSVPLEVIFVGQMGHLMALFQCWGCSMILPGMLIKEEARGKVCSFYCSCIVVLNLMPDGSLLKRCLSCSKVLLLCIWSHGMLMYLSFWILGKTMERYDS